MASYEQLNGGRPQLPRRHYSPEALQRIARAYVPGLFDFWDFEVTGMTSEMVRRDTREAATHEWLRTPLRADQEWRAM